jgi:hypothetical protein
MKPSDQIYWIKIGLAVVLALFSIFVQTFIKLDGVIAFLIGVTIYLALSDLLAMYMKIERQRGFKIGVGAFIFVWLMSWTLFYTVLTI